MVSKTIMKNLLFILSLFSLLSIFMGCNKENEIEKDYDTHQEDKIEVKEEIKQENKEKTETSLISEEKKSEEDILILAEPLNDINIAIKDEEEIKKETIKENIEKKETEKIDVKEEYEENIIEESNSSEKKIISHNEIQYYYGNGNGHLISYESNPMYEVIEREFSYTPDQWWLSDKDIFISTERSIKLGILENGDKYSFNKIKYYEPLSENDKDNYILWANVTLLDKNITGWINCGTFNKASLPYTDESYTLVEEKDIDGKKITIRNLEGTSTSYKTTVDFYENPSFSSKIIKTFTFAIEDENGYMDYVTPLLSYTLITEEEEIKEASEIKVPNPWVYINYDGVEGWVYGGDLDNGRGGYKFKTPINQLMWSVVDSNLV